MKKLMLLFVALFASQMTFAQQDWSKLNSMYNDIFKTAENVGNQTDRVIAEETLSDDELTSIENTISLMKSSGAVTFKKELDPEMPVEFYKYTLIKPDGKQIPLVEKMLIEKVIEKYEVVLNRLKAKLKEDRGAAVQEIMGILDDL